jgi:hypothetical protein
LSPATPDCVTAVTPFSHGSTLLLSSDLRLVAKKAFKEKK